LDRAIERTLGYPRALEALYAILSADRYTYLSEVLELSLPENVVDALVGEAFSRLDNKAQKVIQALAIYNQPVPPAAVDYLLTPHLPAINSAPILQRLVNMHFARKESGRFYLHPVDREFAFGLIPKGEYVDNLRSSGGMELYNYLLNLLDKYPDLLENEESLQQAAQEENQGFLMDLVTAFSNLDPSLLEMLQNEKNFEEEAFLVTLNESLQIPQIWTQYCLLSRAAGYFEQITKSPEEWKDLNDLAAQLAEFQLRCAADDYDLATSIVLEISNLLELWGHYRLMIDLHNCVKDKIFDQNLYLDNLLELGNALWRIGETHHAATLFKEGLELSRVINDRNREGVFLGGLGNTLSDLGDKHQAIKYDEEALAIARETSDQFGEGVLLGNLGNAYRDLAELEKALEFHKNALSISIATNDKYGEIIWLANLGHDLRDANRLEEAIEYYEQSITLADKISMILEQNYARWGLAQVYLFSGNLLQAKSTIIAALNFDVPENNHNVSTLHGIIALQQGEKVAASQAFTRAVAQANGILDSTPEFYSALNAKGIALSGLLLCNQRKDHPRKIVEQANDVVGIFQKSWKISPYAGIVKQNLRLFDELAKCDTEGILKDVRMAVEGKEPPSRPSPEAEEGE
jgi:tetratricopeptide (TPR) repeat protein